MVKMDDQNVENYKLLATGIIQRAVVDYEQARRDLNSKSRTIRERGEILLSDVEKFFKSSWFELLSNHCDGEVLLKKLDENFNKYGGVFINNKRSYKTWEWGEKL